MRQTVEWLADLKLRAGYAAMANAIDIKNHTAEDCGACSTWFKKCDCKTSQ